jgi:hypothetical protein
MQFYLDQEEPLLGHSHEKSKPIGFFQALLLPGVIMVCLEL